MRTMSKRDYFLRAMNAGCYRHKAWVLEAFAYIDHLSGEGKSYPYALTRGAGGVYSFVDPQTHDVTTLEEDGLRSKPGEVAYAFHNEPPLKLLTPIAVAVGEVPNIHQPTDTYFGNLLINYTCLIYAFGDKVTFVPGPTTIKKMEAMVEKRLTDTPPPHTPRDPSRLYIDEYKLFNDGVRMLEGYTQLCVPSATVKTMTVSPEVIKRRDELFAQFTPEQLQDPIILAGIEKELIDMEKAWIKGDPAERFYIKAKSFDVVRKKLFLTQGQENGFGKTGKTIKFSLSEGWDAKNLPAMANALRNGSYSRGFLTALGGVDAKNNYRVFQNTVVAEEDCHSTLGLRILLSKDIAKYFLTSSVINADGSVTELSDDNLWKYTDTVVVIRTPAYCKTEGHNLCAVCVSKKIAATPNAISTYASGLGSTFMSLMLSLMHGAALKTATVDYLSELS